MIQKPRKDTTYSKNHTQKHRPHFALNRNVAGLTKLNKDSIFTLVSDTMDGPYITDIDNNQYIDLTMGFGSILFGHNYQPIREAIKQQLDKSWSVGPISPLAGELAKEITTATNTERVAFFNSGTEAIMVAIRIAKAATNKQYIVFFRSSYHGTMDSLLTLKKDHQTHQAKEYIPGITQSTLNESFFFDYGSEEAISFIKENHHQIAAVLVEPVQSRNPSYQPVEYLKTIRTLTSEMDIALIFDEVITGFRVAIGGCQKLFNIQADIVTYGKVIGGGLPIGIVAGKSKYLDTIDGGYWNYGDDSMPLSKQTFVAGTFCHHPLAMVSALKTLELLNATEGKLLEDLNTKTSEFCERMNMFFSKHCPKISIVHFGSLFRFVTPGKHKTLYKYLLENGIYIWEGRNCFLSVAHSDEIVQQLEEKIKLSCTQLIENQQLKTQI